MLRHFVDYGQYQRQQHGDGRAHRRYGRSIYGSRRSAARYVKVIADQTNLPAECRIEGGAHGEAGRGFGGIADEVRKLSKGSNRFNEEIRSAIGEPCMPSMAHALIAAGIAT